MTGQTLGGEIAKVPYQCEGEGKRCVGSSPYNGRVSCPRYVAVDATVPNGYNALGEAAQAATRPSCV